MPVVIPLHTVVLEELAFRGVLQGMVRRDRGARAGVVVSSLVFGLWHLGSAGAALDGNEAVAGTVGTSAVTTVLGMLAIVVATGLAGAVLALARERSGSLLAPLGLHWAANAVGPWRRTPRAADVRVRDYASPPGATSARSRCDFSGDHCGVRRIVAHASTCSPA